MVVIGLDQNPYLYWELAKAYVTDLMMFKNAFPGEYTVGIRLGQFVLQFASEQEEIAWILNSPKLKSYKYV